MRLGLAKQWLRPRVDQLRSALDFGVDTTTGKPGGSGGNSKLDPWRADALDLSWEKYWGNKAYISAATFFKDLKSYIYEQSKSYDFSKFMPGTGHHQHRQLHLGLQRPGRLPCVAWS